MPAVTTIIKNQCNGMVNLGTTPTGATKLGSLSIGTLASTASSWDAQKALNIVTALSNCLEVTLVEVRYIATSRLEEN